MFVQLDSTSPLPKWIPPTHIRFALQDYGLEQLVGAIKLRIQEQGGVIKLLDAAGRAQAVRREADYIADRDRLMRDGQWIFQLHNSIRATLNEVGRLVGDINSQNGLKIEFGTQDRMGILRSGFVSVGIGWHQPIFGLVGDDRELECYLRVAEFSGLLQMPGENRYYIESPRQLKEHKFKVDVDQDRSLIWRLGKTLIPAERLADEITQIFLELVSRANRGKIEPPHL